MTTRRVAALALALWATPAAAAEEITSSGPSGLVAGRGVSVTISGVLADVADFLARVLAR